MVVLGDVAMRAKTVARDETLEMSRGEEKMEVAR